MDISSNEEGIGNDRSQQERSMEEVFRQLQATPYGVRLNILGISPGVVHSDGGPSTGTRPRNQTTNLEDNSDLSFFNNLSRNRNNEEESNTYQPTIDGTYVQCYSGHRNSSTVMGVNYFGPRSKFIVSGSDMGCIFIWEASTGKVVTVLPDADNEWIKCLKGHPTTSMLATCGSDPTVKLWSPSDACERNIDRIIEDLKDNTFQQNLPLYIHVMQIEHGPTRDPETRNTHTTTRTTANTNRNDHPDDGENGESPFGECSIQ